ncbi:MAG: radical SAM protein [Desulfobacterales bacterium]|nr:MAG: radical SAM protein [Desulfobacterales bacterium]
MKPMDYLKDLATCELCEHRCKVNRLADETGICRVTIPIVASAALHPAPPASYTVFMAGCNFKCLHCQNWTISQYPDNGFRQRGYEDPYTLAVECIDHLNSASAGRIQADRIFFSGGEPTIHLPYIEQVVAEAVKINPAVKINFDTNGYMTHESLLRVLAFTTSITYDLKAYDDKLHFALTGVSSRPVLRNAGYIGNHAKNKLWEYRIVVIPKINEDEIKPLCKFIAQIDSSLPVCFLAFRPNFALENHIGADRALMNQCVEIARGAGLKNVYWSGYTGIAGTVAQVADAISKKNAPESAKIASTYAYLAGCQTHIRNCLTCNTNQACGLKQYIPTRVC